MSLNPRAPQFHSKSPCAVKESEDKMYVCTPLAYEFPYTLRSIPIPSLQTPYLASPTSVSPYPNRYSPQPKDSPYLNGIDGRASERLPQFTSVMSDYIPRPYPYHPQPHRLNMPPGLPIYVR